VDLVADQGKMGVRGPLPHVARVLSRASAEGKLAVESRVSAISLNGHHPPRRLEDLHAELLLSILTSC